MMMGTLGLDNLAVAFALGPLQLGRRRVLLLGLSFGFAEAGMTLFGAALGQAWLPQAWLPAMMATDAARAGVLATLAVAVCGLVWIRYRPADFVGSAWTLAGLALLLGIDNFVAGGELHGTSFSAAPIMAAGAVIGVLAIAACAAGGALFRLTPRWGALASALMLTGLAVAGIA
jgi:hypothetical protein